MRRFVGCVAALLMFFAMRGCAQEHSAALSVVRGKPFVEVMINGKGPFRFLLDTGTGGAAMVTAQLADVLHLPADGETRINDPSGQGERTAPMVRIDSLTVAGVEFTQVHAVRHALPGAEGSCLGMLGFPLFHDYLLTVDYPHQRMELGTGMLTPDGGRKVFPFRVVNGVPVVGLHLQGGPEIEAQLDTGGGGLSLPEPVAAALRFSEGPETFGKGESLVTRFSLKMGKLAGDVRLGQYTLERPWVEINPAFPLANLGGVPLQYFSLTFDQREGLVRMDGPRKPIELGVTPTPVEIRNRPAGADQPPALVPVG